MTGFKDRGILLLSLVCSLEFSPFPIFLYSTVQPCPLFSLSLFRGGHFPLLTKLFYLKERGGCGIFECVCFNQLDIMHSSNHLTIDPASTQQ